MRVKLDSNLPLGVWVEGSFGKFFQAIEYERLPTFCLSCGRIGHLKENCLVNCSEPDKTPIIMGNSKEILRSNEVGKVVEREVPCKEVGDGPWIQVNYGSKKNKNTQSVNNMSVPLKKSVVFKGDFANLIADKASMAVNDGLNAKLKEVGVARPEVVNAVREDTSDLEGVLNEVVKVSAINAAGGMLLDKPSLLINVNKFEVLKEGIEEGEVAEVLLSPISSNPKEGIGDGNKDLSDLGLANVRRLRRLVLHSARGKVPNS